MNDTLVPIDQAGRIVLPKGIRQELAIRPGDLLKLTVQGQSVNLIPSKRTAAFVRKGKALVFSTTSNESLTQDTVNAALEEIRLQGIAQVSKKKRGP